jgi:uncharacterized protein (DUF1499 family)
MLLNAALIVSGSLLAGTVVTWALMSAASRWRPKLGVRDGKLLPMSRFPKGVSTTAEDDQHWIWIEPLSFDDPAEEAWARLGRVMKDLPRVRVLSWTDSYLRVEWASVVFRFLDDVEFLLDSEARVIHFRASSRVGLVDLGVNRRRMERIRQAFLQARAAAQPVTS